MSCLSAGLDAEPSTIPCFDTFRDILNEMADNIKVLVDEEIESIRKQSQLPITMLVQPEYFPGTFHLSTDLPPGLGSSVSLHVISSKLVHETVIKDF